MYFVKYKYHKILPVYNLKDGYTNSVTNTMPLKFRRPTIVTQKRNVVFRAMETRDIVLRYCLSEKFYGSVKHGPRHTICVEKPLESVWVGPQVG